MGKRFDESFIGYDLRNYQKHYEDVSGLSNLEFGYKFFNILGNYLGLSFEEFYMILVAVVMITIIISVIKIGGNLHLFLVGWYIYFVLISMDQLRNQSALSIMMLTVLPFVTDKEKPLRKELLLLFVSSLFHFSFVFYAIPIILSYKKNSKFAYRFFVIFIALFVFLLLSSYTSVLDSVLTLLSNSSSDAEKYERYIGTRSKLSPFLSLGIYLLSLCSVFFVMKTNRKNGGLNNRYAYENLKKYLNFMLFSSCLLLFLIVNATFYRIPRDLSFISMAYIGIKSIGKQSSFSSRLVVLTVTLIISLGWFFFDIIIKDYYLDYYLNFFNNVIINLS